MKRGRPRAPSKGSARGKEKETEPKQKKRNKKSLTTNNKLTAPWLRSFELTDDDEFSEQIDPKNLLDSFLAGRLSKQEFFQDVWKQRVFVACPSEAKEAETDRVISRFDSLIEDNLFSLHLPTLLENTASEKIFIWMKPLADDTGASSKIDSIEVDEASTAVTCFKSGASLYFRAPAEMAKLFISEMSNDLGLNFSGFHYPSTRVEGTPLSQTKRAPTEPEDGDAEDEDVETCYPLEEKGEIETFVSRKGHVTDWHFDFMENFTFQLSGVKRWKLAPGPQHPLRGFTPHYKNPGTLEQQIKVHRLANPSFNRHQQDALSPFPPHPKEVFEVTLTPGSVMYFPAGFYHRVECLEDSLSINLSMICTTERSSWGDLLLDGLRTKLWRSPLWREGIQIHKEKGLQSARAHLAKMLSDLRSQLDDLTPEALLPRGLLLEQRPNNSTILLEDDDENENEDEGNEKTRPTTRFRLNPIAVLIKAVDVEKVERGDNDSDDEEEGDQEVRYFLHVNFGNEELTSAVNLELRTKERTLEAALDWLQNHEGQNDFRFDLSGLKKGSGCKDSAGSEALLLAVKKLLRFGYLLQQEQ